jgi:hypothetical protein
MGRNPVKEPSEAVRWGVQRRLEFIDFRLFWDGRFNRSDLSQTFGISAQQASSDIAQYLAKAPANLVYDAAEKAYLRTSDYQPTMLHASAERYLLQLVAIENRWMSQSDTWFDKVPPAESAGLLRKRTDASVLLRLLDAIKQRCEIDLSYASITGSPEPARSIAPHALFHAAGRWYVRAWSRDHGDFRDYNLFRIAAVKESRPSSIDPALDFEWMHITNLELAPNPALSLNQQAAIAAEYDMADGSRHLPVRLSLTFYVMTENNLDVEQGILPPGKQQLILVNRADVVAARDAARRLSKEALARAAK